MRSGSSSSPGSPSPRTMRMSLATRSPATGASCFLATATRPGLRIAGEWRELAELDQTDEEANVHLMRRHLAAGDAAAAIRQYEHLERTLERELDATPGAAARRARLEAGQLADRQAGA